MADNLLSLKKRISTIESIKKITSAMKLIASSRYNKQKNSFEANKLYLNEMSNAIKTCLKFVDYSKGHLPTCLIENNSNIDLYIYITSTLGLCGSYNYNLEKLAESHLNFNNDVVFIGEKGYRHYKEKVHHAYNEFLNLLDNLTFSNTNLFRHFLDKIYRENNYRSIYIIYTKYINSFSTIATIEKLLPLKVDIDNNLDIKEPLFEGSVKDVTNLIVPHYFDAYLYHLLLESNLSEQTCRKNSMENATESATKLIGSLSLKYNKARQQSITNEITEIINGSSNTTSTF